MSKHYIRIAGAALLLFIICVLAIHTYSVSRLPQVTIGSTTISIEEAKTAEEQALGLGNRDSLAATRGMLFRFPTPVVANFWMKGMRFPLDFIWIKDNKVADLIEHVAAPLPVMIDGELPTYHPRMAVDAVIEVNAGFIEYNKIKIGDEVKGL